MSIMHFKKYRPVLPCAQSLYKLVRLLHTKVITQERNHHSEQRNRFHERSSYDHVCAEVIGCFGLTCHAFKGAFTDLSDTDTGTDSR